MSRELRAALHDGWQRLQTLAQQAQARSAALIAPLQQRWAALPESVRAPGTLAAAGLGLAALLLLAFYLTVQASVDRAEQRREAAAACQTEAPGDARLRCTAEALAEVVTDPRG